MKRAELTPGTHYHSVTDERVEVVDLEPGWEKPEGQDDWVEDPRTDMRLMRGGVLREYKSNPQIRVYLCDPDSGERLSKAVIEPRYLTHQWDEWKKVARKQASEDKKRQAYVRQAVHALKRAGIKQPRLDEEKMRVTVGLDELMTLLGNQGVEVPDHVTPLFKQPTS